jgi:hypothetical protein
MRQKLVMAVLAACFTLVTPTAAEAGNRHLRGARIHPDFHVGYRVVVRAPRPLPHPIKNDGAPAGSVDFDVLPADTQVFVAGSYRGTVDQFDSFPRTLHLRAGKHQITLKTADGKELWSETVKVVAGREVQIDLQLDSSGS